MSGMDPQTLQLFSYIAAPVGLGQFIWGVVVGRPTNDGKQLVSGGASNSGGESNQDAITRALMSCVLQGGGLGFMACAAVCYFANQYEWAFMAAAGVFIIGSMSGSLAGFFAVKAMRQQ
jgi:hypothetical protein